MIKQTFNLVSNTLLFIGRKTGLTYNEVNILVFLFADTIVMDCVI